MQANRPPSAFESRRLPLLLALAAGLLLAGLLTYFLFLAYEFYGAIAPGVFVGEVAVGGLTREQAAAKLEAAWNEQPIIALTGGEPPLMLYPAQVGLFVDAETSARAAWDVGRGAGRWSERLNRLLRGRDPVVVEPLVIYSHDAALRGLESVAATLGRSPQNARVEYIDQRWQAVEARYGQALDVNATLAALEADPLAVLYSRQLAARFIPLAPEVIDVSGLVADLEARRNIPLKIQGYDP
jgi:hypothetical protein